MTRIQDKFDLVLFDGVCNLCNHAVDFVLIRDKNNRFKFGALQDENVQEILKTYNPQPESLDSVMLVRGDNIYYKSRAALEISKKLRGLWPLFYAFILVPEFIRDPIYDWIARNRYRWFGQRPSCRMPSPEEKEKFLS